MTNDTWKKAPWRTQIDIGDAPYDASKIKEVLSHEGGYTVSAEDGWSLFIAAEPSAPAPTVGETLFLFGKGFGYEVRGIATLRHLYRYATAADAEAARLADIERKQQERHAAWEATGLAAFIEGAKSLPEVFQKRLEFFMRRADWGEAHGGYELFVCTEAVKIAGVCKTPEDVKAFHALDYETQKERAGVADGHSGNTFGMACRLAALYLDKPKLIPKMHGALCGLVGCDEYGCWSTTDEAKREAKREVHGRMRRP